MTTAGGNQKRSDVVLLSELDELGSGGHVGGASTLRRCRYGGRAYLLKRYRPEHLPLVDELALARLIAWRRRLPAADRNQLDRMASWPRFRVRDEGHRLCGVLIPHANVKFSYVWRQRRARTLDALIRLTANGNVRAGAPPAVKCRALAATAEAVLWLHRHGVVVDDVQAENVLCNADGSAIYLVDCDAMIGPWGQVSPPQAPDYVRNVVPDADQPNDTTDLARLAWMAMWVLLDDFSVTVPSPQVLRGAVGERHGALLAQIGKARRWERAPAAEWAGMAAEWGGVPAPAPPSMEILTGTVLPPVASARLTHRPVGHARRPYEWIPDRFRRQYEPGPAFGSVPEVPLAGRKRRVPVPLVLALAVVVAALVLADVLWEVIR